MPKLYKDYKEMVETGVFHSFIENKRHELGDKIKKIDDLENPAYQQVITKLQAADQKLIQGIQAFDPSTDNSDWQPWDALEEAFDKIMEFIGTIDIDAIITLATTAMELALAIMDKVGGFYAERQEDMSAQQQQAFEAGYTRAMKRLEAMKPNVGDPARAAANSLNEMFNTTYTTHKQTAHTGCLGGRVSSFFSDHKLDKKYRDMARWLHELASQTSDITKGKHLADPDNIKFKFTERHLATAFLLVYQASNHQPVMGDMGKVVMPVHSKGGHATENFHSTIELINDAITAHNGVAFFEPHAYKSDISKADMESLIARSEHLNIKVPEKIMEMYNSNTVQVQFQAAVQH